MRSIRQIAVAVRKWAEINRYHLGGGAIDLEGLCAVASAELYRRVKLEHGPDANIKLAVASASGFYHVFCVVNGSTIVDVTATQFDWKLKNVEIRPLGSDRTAWWWEVQQLFDSDDELHLHQVNTDWVIWQCANDHLCNRSKLSCSPIG